MKNKQNLNIKSNNFKLILFRNNKNENLNKKNEKMKQVINNNLRFCSEKLYNDADFFNEEDKKKLIGKIIKLKLDHSNQSIKELERFNKIYTPLTKNIIKNPNIIECLKDNKIPHCLKLVYKFTNLLEKLKKKIDDMKILSIKIIDKNEKIQMQINLNNLIKQKNELEENLKNEKSQLIFKHKNSLKIFYFTAELTHHFVYITELCKTNLSKFCNNFKTNFLNKRISCDTSKRPWLNYMSENLMKFFIMQLIDYLEAMNEFTFVHGNLIMENILISNNYQLKVTDYACSKYIAGTEIFPLIKNEKEKDQEFQPPEYFRQENYVEPRNAFKIDLYSVGCILHKFATNNSDNIINQNLLHDLNEHKEKDFLKKIDDRLKKFDQKYYFDNTEIARSHNFISFLQSKIYFLIYRIIISL